MDIEATTVKFPFTDEFRSSLLDILYDEMKIASSKWRVSLSEDESSTVVRHSLAQLNGRLSSIGDKLYEFNFVTSQEFEILLHGLKRESSLTFQELLLDEETKNLQIRKEKNSFRVEENAEANSSKHLVIPVEYLERLIKETIEKWLRTAVFYGVGSYKK